jgi:hypothetical protein
VVHVKTRRKSRKGGKGAQLFLTCPHQSSNLLTKTISKPNIRTSGVNALTDIINQLNDPQNKASKDPTIVIESPFNITTKNGIDLDPGTANDFIFESVKVKQAIDDIIKKEAGTVEEGGSFEWFNWRLVSMYAHPSDTDLDKVKIQVFAQGYQNNSGWSNIPNVTIKKKALTAPKGPLLQTEGNQEAEQGTNLIAIGGKSAGSYPKEFSMFQGAKSVFNSALNWDNSVAYKEGALVKAPDGNTYEAIVDNTASQPPSANWIQRTFTKPSAWLVGTNYGKNTLVRYDAHAYKSLQASNLGNTPDNEPTWWTRVSYVPGIDYSPLTKDKAQYFINAGAGWIHAGTANNNQCGFLDHNVIIKDDLHPRTWVHTAQTTSVGFPSELKDGGDYIEELRVLVNGTGAGDFAGFTNKVIRFRNGAWSIYKNEVQDSEIFSKREGESWTYNPCQGVGSFVDNLGVCQLGSRSGDWVKGAYALDFGNIGHFFDNEQFNCFHPYKRSGSNVEVGNEQIMNEDGSTTSAVFANFAPLEVNANSRYPYSFIAGLNFTMMVPDNSNAIPHGAVTVGEKIANAKMDFSNMHKDHLGGREWFGPNVEDYYPIQAFAYIQLFQEFISGGALKPFAGDYSFTLWLADGTDNKVAIEYTHSVNGITVPQTPGVKKAQAQRSIPGISTFIPGREPEVLDIFDWRNVVWGGIETKDSFDESGRYKFSGKPISSFLDIVNNRFAFAEKLHLSIDAWRLLKPLVATNIFSGAKPERNIEPKKLRADGVINYQQLKNLVINNTGVFGFERQAFPLDTQMRCDVVYGDSIYYEDDELVDEADDALTNTIKLVADEIVYTVSKPAQGPGGFLRTINGVTRIWP